MSPETSTSAPQQTVTIYLTCKDASAALKFYGDAFGAKELYRLPGPGGALMHAEMMIGTTMVMLADEFPDYDALSPATVGGCPVSNYLQVHDADATIDKAVSFGAKVVRPAQDEFYGQRTGMIEDPFGYKWMIAQTIEELTYEDITKRFEEMMSHGEG